MLTLDDPLALLLCLLPIIYLSIAAHEAGHVLLGRAVGFVVTSVGIGLGKPWLHFSIGGIKVFFCAAHPFQGLTFSYIPQVIPPRNRLALYFAGGIIANSVCAVIALLSWRWLRRGDLFFLATAAVNSGFAVLSAVPFQFPVGKAMLRSDGQLILHALRNNSLAAPAPLTIQFVSSLRVFWQAIGDHLTYRANLLAAAAAWAELEDFVRALGVIRELDSLPRCDRPDYLAREALVKSAIDLGSGQPDRAAELVETALGHFRSTGDEAGMIYALIQRAQMRIATHDLAGARADIDSIRSHELVDRVPAMQLLVEMLELAIGLATSDSAGTAEILSRYESIRPGEPSLTWDLRVSKMVARAQAQRGEWVEAEAAFRRAFTAVKSITLLWADVSDQERFVANQSALFDEARQCFAVLNKLDALELIIQPLQAPEQLREMRRASAPERHRRLFKWALRVMVANAAVVACAIVLGLLVELERLIVLVAIVGFQFVLFTCIGALYLLFHFAIGRFVPALRESGGAVILILACLPWINLLILPILYLLMPVP